MSIALDKPLYTTEDLLAMPNDGKERWLIRGELREKPMTVRNRFHSHILINVGHCLKSWQKTLPKPRGRVLGGEAGIRLQNTKDSTVGVDLAYVSPETMANQNDETSLIDGIPVVMVEILSPSDTIAEIEEKIDLYLEVGVPLVWIIDPHDRTVSVYQPGKKPALFTEDDQLTAEPYLPGFRVSVTQFFED